LSSINEQHAEGDDGADGEDADISGVCNLTMQVLFCHNSVAVLDKSRQCNEAHDAEEEKYRPKHYEHEVGYPVNNALEASRVFLITHEGQSDQEANEG